MTVVTNIKFQNKYYKIYKHVNLLFKIFIIFFKYVTFKVKIKFFLNTIIWIHHISYMYF